MSDNSSASDEGLLQATQALENEKQPIHIQPIASSGGRFKDPVSEKETEDLSLKQEPKELGCFSQDESRIFQHNKTSLKYLSLPDQPNSVSFAMWEGYGNFISRDESIKEYLNHLLQWVLLNRDCFVVQSDQGNENHLQRKLCLNTDFVSWRGLLTKLLCTPYENREGWKIACTKFNGTVYMCEFDTDDRKAQKESQTEKQKIMTYGGYKFEQFLCADKPSGNPNVSRPVNNNEAFCSVVRSRLQQHSMVYGGEVDCCETSNGNKYVELKTSREIYHWKQDENFKRFKLLKWWAQSFLVGIPKIICGFRNDDGVVERLETFYTLDIPKMCKDVKNCWNASVCFNFLDAVLKYIKQTVTEDNPRVVYLFEYSASLGKIICEKQNSDSEYEFLPAWYYDKQDCGT